MREKQEQEDSDSNEEKRGENTHATEKLFVSESGELIVKKQYEMTIGLHGCDMNVKFEWDGSA